MKPTLGRMGEFARARSGKPLPQSIATVCAGWAVSKHVQQFVLASEGGLWQPLIPALGSSPSRGGRGPCSQHSLLPETLSIRKLQLKPQCNPHTKRWSLVMGLPA